MAETKEQTGVELITAERARQVSQEGWTLEHDDEHDNSELLDAADCYLQQGMHTARGGDSSQEDGWTMGAWPWERSWWKPDYLDPIPNLVKAAALIAAEIDRLQRLRESSHV